MLESEIPLWQALVMVGLAVIGPNEWHSIAVEVARRKLGLSETPETDAGDAQNDAGVQ